METIFSNSIRKLLRLEITKMLIEGLKNKFIVLFIIIFSTLWCDGWDVIVVSDRVVAPSILRRRLLAKLWP